MSVITLFVQRFLNMMINMMSLLIIYFATIIQRNLIIVNELFKYIIYGDGDCTGDILLYVVLN